MVANLALDNHKKKTRLLVGQRFENQGSKSYINLILNVLKSLQVSRWIDVCEWNEISILHWLGDESENMVPKALSR